MEDVLNEPGFSILYYRKGREGQSERKGRGNIPDGRNLKKNEGEFV